MLTCAAGIKRSHVSDDGAADNAGAANKRPCHIHNLVHTNQVNSSLSLITLCADQCPEWCRLLGLAGVLLMLPVTLLCKPPLPAEHGT